jgi:hypothetical protein
MEAGHYRNYAASMPATGPAQANALGARAVSPKGLLRPMSTLGADSCKQGSLRTGKPAAWPRVRRGDIGEYDAHGGGAHALQRDTSATARCAPKRTRKMCVGSVSSSGACPVHPLKIKVDDAMRAGNGTQCAAPHRVGTLWRELHLGQRRGRGQRRRFKNNVALRHLLGIDGVSGGILGGGGMLVGGTAPRNTRRKSLCRAGSQITLWIRRTGQTEWLVTLVSDTHSTMHNGTSWLEVGDR